MKRKKTPKLLRMLSTAGIVVAITSASGMSRSIASAPRSPSSIHIAVVTSLTGTYSEIGTAMLEGAKAGARAINDAGGIMSRKVVLDAVDTVGDPADAVPAFNKEIAFQHPVGVIGPTTLEIFALQPLIDRNRIPDMFNGGSTLFDHNTDKWIWRINASDSQLGVAMALYARRRGYSRAAILFSTEQSAQTLKPLVASTFKKLGGQIVSDVNITPNQTSYRSEVLKVDASHPQLIFTQMEPTTAAVALANFKEIDNLKVPFIGTDITAGGDWIKAVTPKIANKVMTSVQGSSALGGGGAVFQRYNRLVNHHQALSGTNYAYDGIIVLALAIDAARSTDSTKIIRNMFRVANPPGSPVFSYKQALTLLNRHRKFNYEGASGPMDFNRYHNVSGPWDVVKVQPNGSVKTLITLSAKAVSAASH